MREALVKSGLRPATLLKKVLWQRCFPVTFAKLLRTPFFTEHLRGLFLWKTSTADYISLQTVFLFYLNVLKSELQMT